MRLVDFLALTEPTAAAPAFAPKLNPSMRKSKSKLEPAALRADAGGSAAAPLPPPLDDAADRSDRSAKQSDAPLDRSARHWTAAADAPAWPKAAPLRSAAHARAAEADESATSLEQLLHEINAGRTELQSQAWRAHAAWHGVRCAL
jgi:hypothetical protein